MRVYVNAIKNSMTSDIKPHLLIIEEINRANVAAVFGDVFQLLDRNSSGISEYPIQASEDMRKYLADVLKVPAEKVTKIKIPDNMFIWASMNSADQGVFPMDTAFKRRWDFDYIGIDDNENDLKGKTVIVGEKEQQKIEWNSLRKAINTYLADNNVNEDKQLGPYFISRDIVVPKDTNEIDSEKFSEVFKNKVLMYLFEDAGRRLKELFGGVRGKNTRYSEICKAFQEQGIGVFHPDIQRLVEVKEPIIDNSEVQEKAIEEDTE